VQARLVFAEHRYYGESMPFAPGTKGCMSWLTTEQAMADFAYLIDTIRQEKGAAKSPFIGFGGSCVGHGLPTHPFLLFRPNLLLHLTCCILFVCSFFGVGLFFCSFFC
jgi:hypothetical protein